MTKKTIGILVAIVVLVGVGLNKISTLPGKYDEFAICLAEKEAVFYGAFWCPHCHEQKALFGKSKKFLPYVECSNGDRSQKDVCKDANIESYPTWVFADGTTKPGNLSLEELSEITGCELDQT